MCLDCGNGKQVVPMVLGRNYKGENMNKKIKNDAGTTLVELMIYMIIGLIVITAVYKIITTVTTTYVQGRAVSKGQFNARDVINSMTKDIASMGYKNFTDYTDDIDATCLNIGCKRVDLDFGSTRNADVVGGGREAQPGNRAAFFFVDGGAGNNDVLEFFRIRTADRNLNERDVRVARERILYLVNANDELIREIWTWDPTIGDWGAPQQITILSGVAALDFRFSRIGMDGTWTSNLLTAAGADAIRRDEVRHVEVSVLVRSHRRSSATAIEYTMPSGRVLNFATTPPSDRRVHRLYTQSIEVPNNATGF